MSRPIHTGGDPPNSIGAGARHATGAAFARRRRLWIRRAYLLPLLVYACMTLPYLWQGSFQVDTGWYSAIGLQSWRAAADGDWSALWTLRGYGGAAGDPYFNKPPLAFWVHGFVLWLLGPTIFAARLPAVIAGAGALVATIRAVSLLAGRRMALASGLVLALTLEFTRHSRAFSLDMWQLLFLMSTLALAVEGVRRAGPSRIAAAGVPLGLALMTKPLVALLALPMLAAWLAWERRWRAMAWLPVAGAIALVIAAPWHLSMHALHGRSFLDAYFGREIMARAAGRLSGYNAGADSPLYYAIELARAYWPWALTLGLAVIAWARSRLPRRLGPALRLGLVWSGAWLILLSCFADKRPRYLLPIYPAWAWLSAAWLLHAPPHWLTRARRASRRWAPAALAAGAAALSLLPISIERTREPWWDELFAALRAAGYPSDVALWDGGGTDGARGARVYLEFERWPGAARNPAGEPIAAPPVGSLIIYHDIDGWKPGPGETVVFDSGPITVSRLTGEWRPIQ